jgi:hypothetical protein
MVIGITQIPWTEWAPWKQKIAFQCNLCIYKLIAEEYNGMFLVLSTGYIDHFIELV